MHAKPVASFTRTSPSGSEPSVQVSIHSLHLLGNAEIPTTLPLAESASSRHGQDRSSHTFLWHPRVRDVALYNKII